MKNVFFCLKNSVLLCGLVAFVLFGSCSSETSISSSLLITKSSTGTTSLKVTSWNLQTFFDGETSGNEYSEFVKSNKWGTEAYVDRLEKLCSVIHQLDSDVFIMEEVENENVLYDIYNFLAGEWNFRKVYNYGAFATDPGSSIGIGILSRYPLSDLKVHSLDIQTNGKQPSMRPLVTVSVKAGDSELIILMNHWKSMSGGKSETEYWRKRQECVLANQVKILEEKGIPWISAGDFNRDLYDFNNYGEGNSISFELFDKGAFKSDEVYVKNPWKTEDGILIGPGSYYFQGKWSRIDHFFYGTKASINQFWPETDGIWCDSTTNIPIGYKLYSQEGYSDHLPITCIVTF